MPPTPVIAEDVADVVDGDVDAVSDGVTVPAFAVHLYGQCVVAVVVPELESGAGVNVDAGGLERATVSLAHDQDVETSAFPL